MVKPPLSPIMALIEAEALSIQAITLDVELRRDDPGQHKKLLCSPEVESLRSQVINLLDNAGIDNNELSRKNLDWLSLCFYNHSTGYEISNLKERLKFEEHAFGDGSLRTKSTRDDLTKVIARARNAVPLLKRVLASEEKVYGLDAPDTQFTRSHLEKILEDIGEVATHDRAPESDSLEHINNAEEQKRQNNEIEAKESQLAAQERAFGDDPKADQDAFELVHLYDEAGRRADAEQLRRKYNIIDRNKEKEDDLARHERVLGRDSPAILIEAKRLVELYRDERRNTDANRIINLYGLPNDYKERSK